MSRTILPSMPQELEMCKKLKKAGLQQRLFNDAPVFYECELEAGDVPLIYSFQESRGWDERRIYYIPSSDDLSEELKKISPYLKIRLLPVGYYSDDEGSPIPAKESERWGSTVDGDGSDYNWCGSLWETLALAYLRITKHI